MSGSMNGIDELRARVRGRSVAPSDPGYDDARRVWNPRYSGAEPALVSFPADADDVATAVRAAREHDLWLVPRGGGHSFSGFSTGNGCVVLDLSAMSAVRLEPDGETVTVGAGARVVDVYEALAARGATISAGECMHVGVAGLALGGGLGFLSRLHGLTCDGLAGLDMVDADGALVSASQEENTDLFWACRGAGGCNYGVATSFRFRALPAPRVTRFKLRWAWERAASVVAAWQAWAPAGPDELFGTLRLENTPRGPGATPRVTVSGCYVGDPDGFAPLREELVEAVGAPAELDQSGQQEWLDAVRVSLEDPAEAMYAGCEGEADFEMASRAAYAREPLPAGGIETIVEWLERRQDDPVLNSPAPEFRPGVVLIEPYGGAVGRVAPEATAFVHRDELFLMLFEARWHHRHSEPAAHEEWIGSWYERMLPFTSGFSYQNYPDLALEDWERAYYGDNLARLREIKARRDPDVFFRFARGIRPPES